jgi:hypothetical protein
MALVLKADVGASDANAYCTEAEATAYHSTRGFNAAWTEALVPTREMALVWATRLLDQQDWNGMRASFSSALRWPQVGQVDRDDQIIPSTIIPQFLKEACAEWAFYLLVEDRTADEGGLVQYGGKVGPIDDPKMYVRKTMPASVRDMLQPYLATNPSGVGRVGRV